MNVTRCRDCQAPIVWTETPNGKKSPVNAQPAFGGNIEILDPEAATPLSRTLTKPELEAAGKSSRYYRSHFVTCPKAKQRRKP